MNNDYSTIFITIVNLALLVAIIFFIYKGLTILRNFLRKHKEMNFKIDTILNKLEDK